MVFRCLWLFDGGVVGLRVLGFVVWGDCLLANYLGYWLIVLCLEILYF